MQAWRAQALNMGLPKPASLLAMCMCVGLVVYVVVVEVSWCAQVAARAQGGGLQRAGVRCDAAQRAAQRGARALLAPASLGGCAAVRPRSARLVEADTFKSSCMQRASSSHCLSCALYTSEWCAVWLHMHVAAHILLPRPGACKSVRLSTVLFPPQTFSSAAWACMARAPA